MRTLIVDDHSLFNEGLKLLLETLGVASQVQCCVDAETALACAAQQPWDLVLLDWNLGPGSAWGGVALIGALVQALPTARVVVVSAEASAGRVREAIEAGAAGFVPKEASAQLLIDAIRMISHGAIYLPPSVMREGQPARETALGSPALSASHHVRDAFPSLSPRQIEVLLWALRGHANKVIARQLNIAEGTVKQHLNTVYRDLQVKGRTEAVYLMARRGLKVFE